jgi:hypothetical protein
VCQPFRLIRNTIGSMPRDCESRPPVLESAKVSPFYLNNDHAGVLTSRVGGAEQSPSIPVGFGKFGSKIGSIDLSAPAVPKPGALLSFALRGRRSHICSLVLLTRKYLRTYKRAAQVDLQGICATYSGRVSSGNSAERSISSEWLCRPAPHKEHCCDTPRCGGLWPERACLRLWSWDLLMVSAV